MQGVDETVRVRPGMTRERAIDVAACLATALLGALFLSPALRDPSAPMPGAQVVTDIVAGAIACCALWWQRVWPLGVAVTCVLLGAVAISATPAGLFALFSLAVHRPFRIAWVGLALWVPVAVTFAVYSPTTDPLSVVVVTTPIALAATAWGMFVRARRQLLLTLRERAQRAEADQVLHEERARMAERTRIAREMHDVLAHRISLVALHAGALEVRPDLPHSEVRDTARLLGSTARQALEELRSVIGVLREDPGDGPGRQTEPLLPQPRLSDIPRLVEETRLTGAKIHLEIRVARSDSVPVTVGRDAYRIVQEALTNIGKHAVGTAAHVLVADRSDGGLHVSVRNRQAVHSLTGPNLPGAGAGLLGLQERVTLAGGTLRHGPDGTGDFVVEAELPCPA